MVYVPRQHHRRSIRLPTFDYSQAGAYFITIVCQGSESLLGDIVGGDVLLSPYGEITRDEWCRTPSMRTEVDLDEFVVMPNHLHGIVIIKDLERFDRDVGAHGRAPLRRRPRSLGSFMAGFKAATTRRINRVRQTPRQRVWQRNYYERVIRDEAELARIRRYIAENPTRWEDDPENPAVGRMARVGAVREPPLR